MEGREREITEAMASQRLSYMASWKEAKTRPTPAQTSGASALSSTSPPSSIARGERLQLHKLGVADYWEWLVGSGRGFN